MRGVGNGGWGSGGLRGCSIVVMGVGGNGGQRWCLGGLWGCGAVVVVVGEGDDRGLGFTVVDQLLEGWGGGVRNGIGARVVDWGVGWGSAVGVGV